MPHDLDSLRDMVLAANRVLRYVENTNQQEFEQN
jgi:uncharacterized protein with HEPN domain